MSGWRKRTIMEMAREAGAVFPADGSYHKFEFEGSLERFAGLVRADECEQIAQMIEDAPALMEFAQNDQGGCLMCGFTPKLAAKTIRARGQA